MTTNSVPFSMNTLSMIVCPAPRQNFHTTDKTAPRTWNMFQQRRRWNLVAPVQDPVVDAHGPKDVRVERYGCRITGSLLEGVLLSVFGDELFLPCPVPVDNVVPIYGARVGAFVARFRRRATRKRGFEAIEKNKGGKRKEGERDFSTTWW